MKLSRAQFEDRYAAGTLKLALIGMSNIGKSYSGMRLATDFDFTLTEVDKLIWEELGESDMDAFAAWQGQPYSDGYEDRERQSMRLESAATAKALSTTVRNPLLDTTGSVIYADPDVLSALSRDWFTVYIEAAPDHLERLQQLYFAHPKPLAWAGHFRMIDGLDKIASLKACYPDLLASRHLRYNSLADHTISSADILTRNNARLLELVKPVA